MPSVFSHAVVGLSAWACLPPAWRSKRLLAACALVPTLPDLDAIGFGLGVPYESFWGHRGFVHSLSFGLVVGTLLALLWRLRWAGREPAWVAHVLFPLLWASHCLLDMATSGGLGIALLSPFDTTRLFFPYAPIRVSPMSPRAFFGARGLVVLRSELIWVWLPSLLAVIAARVIGNRGGAYSRIARDSQHKGT